MKLGSILAITILSLFSLADVSAIRLIKKGGKRSFLEHAGGRQLQSKTKGAKAKSAKTGGPCGRELDKANECIVEENLGLCAVCYEVFTLIVSGTCSDFQDDACLALAVECADECSGCGKEVLRLYTCEVDAFFDPCRVRCDFSISSSKSSSKSKVAKVGGAKKAGGMSMKMGMSMKSMKSRKLGSGDQ